jgi:hypothetical protein
MFTEMMNAILRHAITGAAGVLVTHGYATNDQAQALVGGVMAVVGIYMSYRHKQAMLAKQGSN